MFNLILAIISEVITIYVLIFKKDWLNAPEKEGGIIFKYLFYIFLLVFTVNILSYLIPFIISMF
jgi:hypothetical protein